MTELLIGMVMGVAVCWTVLYATEKAFERRPS